MSRNIELSIGEFYHIYNRGTEKRNIFSDAGDYERFLSLLYLCNSTEPVDIKLQGSTLYEVLNIKRENNLVDLCVYCLMPNHFHLIIREVVEGGTSRFIQKMITGYTMYFNKKNERTGSLFQGKFKATHVSEDNYLSYLISYIHLNPVKIIEPLWKENGIKDRKSAEIFLKKYKYSSYLDYIENNRPESVIINKNAFPEYFENPKDFEESISEWLNYKSTHIELQGSTL